MKTTLPDTNTGGGELPATAIAETDHAGERAVNVALQLQVRRFPVNGQVMSGFDAVARNPWSFTTPA